MKNTITIPVPEGKKATQIGDPSIGAITIVFEDMPTPSKSWEEYCSKHTNCIKSWYLRGGEGGVIPRPAALTSLGLFDFTTSEDAEGMCAFLKLVHLRREWIGSWEPDWEQQTVKYCIIYVLMRPNIDTEDFCIVGYKASPRNMTFPTKEMAEEFLKTFKPLLEQAKMFL